MSFWENKKVFDISLPISENMIQFPGDPEIKIKQEKSIAQDDYNLTSITMGAHTGTHLDVPLHFIDGAKSIDKLSLERFIGLAQVIVISDTEKITVNELKKNEINAEFILFKTKNSNNLFESEFHKDFIYLTEEAARFLLDKGVKLVGIDYLSVEKYEEKAAPVHKLLLKNEVIILEGIALSAVEAGVYTLVVLPLNIVGSEGAPARAILLSD